MGLLEPPAWCWRQVERGNDVKQHLQLEARSLDAREKEAGATRKAATDDIKVSAARTEHAVTTEDLPEAAVASGGIKSPDRKGRGK
jgi:hypothetical protein